MVKARFWIGSFLLSITFVSTVWSMNDGEKVLSKEKSEKLKKLHLSDVALNAVAAVNAKQGFYSARSPRSPHSPHQHISHLPSQDSPTTRLATTLMEGGDVIPVLRPLEINRVIDEQGNTCLHLASEQNNKLAVIEMLKLDAINVNAQNSLNDTPLHVAAALGHSEIVDLLLAHPMILPNLPNKKGDTALHIAAKKLQKVCIQALLLNLKVDKELLNHNSLRYWDYCKKDDETKRLVKETIKIRNKMQSNSASL